MAGVWSHSRILNPLLDRTLIPLPSLRLLFPCPFPVPVPVPVPLPEGRLQVREAPFSRCKQPALSRDSPHALVPLRRDLFHKMMSGRRDDESSSESVSNIRLTDDISPGCRRHTSHPSRAHYPNPSHTAAGL